MQPTHVVLVGLDGLRADMMTPDTTPHLTTTRVGTTVYLERGWVE